MSTLHDELTGVVHGGPDGGGSIAWDFSSNANAVALPPHLMARLLDADRRYYPDPHYVALRTQLAQASGGHPDRILPTAGSSEGIRRLTLALHGQSLQQVWVPVPGYGDYRAAAQALGVGVCGFDPVSLCHETGAAALQQACRQGPVLLWLCDPCNPTGRSLDDEFWRCLSTLMARHPSLIVALDRAYEPLRLQGRSALPLDLVDACWQFHSPNKALGLTGVRAGWAQAPHRDPLGLAQAMLHLAPSWVLSAEGVHLLSQWHLPDVQDWVATSRLTLFGWMRSLQLALTQRGWTPQPSSSPFCVAQPPTALQPYLPALTTHLRAMGLKWRDASSLGLPGMVRLRAHEPAAQQVLLSALDAWTTAQIKSTRSAA